jgi:hypothetical protein
MACGAESFDFQCGDESDHFLGSFVGGAMMKKKLTNVIKIVGGIVLALSLMLAGFVILQPKRRRITVQHV